MTRQTFAPRILQIAVEPMTGSKRARERSGAPGAETNSDRGVFWADKTHNTTGLTK